MRARAERCGRPCESGGMHLVLEYALGERRSILWALSATSLETFELPGRAENGPLGDSPTPHR